MSPAAVRPSHLATRPSDADRCRQPDNFPNFSRQNYEQQRLRSSVYSLELSRPPPKQSRPGAMAALPYIVQVRSQNSIGSHTCLNAIIMRLLCAGTAS